MIGTSVRAALSADYPDLEVLVLDDGSTDQTAAAAQAAAAQDPRLEVVRDPENRGKGAQLNLGFQRARHELVVVTDSDTHMHPAALKLLVSRIQRSSRIAAVAGGPYVTNRRTLWSALQSLEAASIIGLIRRTQALIGRVATVAGVLGLFRRNAVLAVGGFNSRMATEDIELSWRLLLADWQTTYEPNALVGMEAPASLTSLWAQRKRWARGQGEVLKTHASTAWRWRHRRLWPLAIESFASLLWVALATLAGALAGISLAAGADVPVLAIGLGWGIAIAVIATLQLAFGLGLRRRYDPPGAFVFLIGPLYPLAYWLISAAAALRSEVPALVRGPAQSHVGWDLPRERVES